MARDISDKSLQIINQSHGTEPISILGVTWVAGGKESWYATKTINAPSTATGNPVVVEGRIIELSNIDSVVAVSFNETSEEFDLVLDDTPGDLKAILDVNDIMLRDVKLYQWFEGLDWEDKFLVFQGKINSPISWSETDRSLKLSVVSQLEDRDVGFSPEEGVFPDLPEDMIGELWPECFGTSIYQQAVQVDYKHTGSLGTAVSIPDFTIWASILALGPIQQRIADKVTIQNKIAAQNLFPIDNPEWSEANEKRNELNHQILGYGIQQQNLASKYAAQASQARRSLRIIGGERFPRTGLKLDIGGAIFHGRFKQVPEGEDPSDIFEVSRADHPELKNYVVKSWNQAPSKTHKVMPFPEYERVVEEHDEEAHIEASGGHVSAFGHADEVTSKPTGSIGGDQAGPFFAQAGAAVTISSNERLRYFVSITPGEVLGIAAFTTFANGEKTLIDVPRHRYSVFVQSYGSISVTVVQMKEALSKLDVPYNDTIYVNFKSSIGPNPIDIMTYLIGKYSSLSYDKASFAKVRGFLQNYPMHFCLKQKKNIITVMKELAFMSRTAISIRSGKFYIRYLPEEPTSIFTFTESNVLEQSMQLDFTPTEDLITKYTAKWRSSGAQEKDHNSIQKANVAKYGIHEETIDMYAYNYLPIVKKVLTFWLIRKANTWKKLTFKTGIDALNVETLDGVTLDFAGQFASNGPVLGTVEAGEFNPNDRTLTFTVWTGVRSGEMEPYDFAYPQNVSAFTRFPTTEDVNKGNAGGMGPGEKAAGFIEAKLHPFQKGQTTNPNPYDDFVIQRNRGSTKPSDQNDKNPGITVPEGTGQAERGFQPDGTPVHTPLLTGTKLRHQENIHIIDIRKTPIVDSSNQRDVSRPRITLDSFFREITDGKLKARTDAIWKNSEDKSSAFIDGAETGVERTEPTEDTSKRREGVFDFKWDKDAEQFGAGTAFLKDDEE